MTDAGMGFTIFLPARHALVLSPAPRYQRAMVKSAPAETMGNVTVEKTSAGRTVSNVLRSRFRCKRTTRKVAPNASASELRTNAHKQGSTGEKRCLFRRRLESRWPIVLIQGRRRREC